MSKNALFKTLISLKGNPRACVYTEPMWGLSMNLCIPYASVYMLALGLSDVQIGLVTTIFMLSQVVFAFLGGPITDKLGRRKTTALFDFLSWSIPCIIWWQAQNFWFFLVAALFNGAMKVPTNSWDCLLVEDAEKNQITSIYSLVIICGQFSALFAPISAVLVARLTLVPAIRILYVNALVIMTAKLIILYIFSRETKTGLIRLSETKGNSIWSLVVGYRSVIRIILKSKGTIFSLVISALVGIVAMVNNTFWQIIANKKLLVPDSLLPLFPMFRSIVAIIFFWTVIPRLMKKGLKIPLFAGFISYAVGQTLLILCPIANYPVLCISLIFDGFGSGILAMLAESLVALHVNKAERARVMAIQHMIIMGSTAPFGWIAGILSDLSRNLPFVMTVCLLITGIIVTLLYYRNDNQSSYNRGEYL
ncbi:MAG: MFS transporter [Treponema sp.]|jgi:MFS family permease|nr:MFS transporter [Treponema sp.]